jgi:hypothetical protein
VLSGNFYLATGETLDRNSGTKLPAGSFGYWPAGMKHAAWSEGETVIQLHWNWAVVNQIRQSGRRPEEREEITLDGVSRNA